MSESQPLQCVRLLRGLAPGGLMHAGALPRVLDWTNAIIAAPYAERGSAGGLAEQAPDFGK